MGKLFQLQKNYHDNEWGLYAADERLFFEMRSNAVLADQAGLPGQQLFWNVEKRIA